MSLNMTRTHKALRYYDTARAILQRIAVTGTRRELEAFDHDVEKAGLAVREAFARDTAHINQRANALRIHPDSEWLRQMATRYG